jgi:hypothetical protein
MTFPITVRIDDRWRLAGAVLAASDWPDREQAAQPYKPHRVAEHARKYFAAFNAHPAAQAVSALVGAGEGLRAFYSHTLTGDWPGDLGAQMADFAATAHPEKFWAETQADWAQAEADVTEVLKRADLGQFLAEVFGPPPRALVVAPNLLFPGLMTVAAQSADEIALCAPPPKAWGASPPWRFSERPDEVLAAFSEAFARALFESHAPAALHSKAGVFALAAAVLFLRQAEGEAAGDQFMLMEKRTRKLPNLPAAVNAVEALLTERRAGRAANYAEYAQQL